MDVRLFLKFSVTLKSSVDSLTVTYFSINQGHKPRGDRGDGPPKVLTGG